MSQTWVALNTATQSPPTATTNQENKLDTLDTMWAGATSPTSPVAGRMWLDTSGTEDIVKVYCDIDGGGNAWVELASVLHGDLSVGYDTSNPNEIKFVLLEQRADVTPASGQVGRIWQNSTSGLVKIVKDASTAHVLVSSAITDTIKTELPLGAWTKGSTPPTDATKGTTPTMAGWQFDATAETAVCNVRVPAGYGGVSDLTLRTFWALNQTETSGDDLDVTVDLVSCQPDNNEAVSKTSTQATGTTDIGSNTADGAVTIVDVTLDYDDATNPIAAGDMLVMEMHLTNVTGVLDPLFMGAQLLAPFGSGLTETS